MASNVDEDDEQEQTWDGIFESLQQNMEKVVLGHTNDIVADAMDQGEEDRQRRLQLARSRVDTSADEQAESYALLDDARDEVRHLLLLLHCGLYNSLTLSIHRHCILAS